MHIIRCGGHDADCCESVHPPPAASRERESKVVEHLPLAEAAASSRRLLTLRHLRASHAVQRARLYGEICCPGGRRGCDQTPREVGCGRRQTADAERARGLQMLQRSCALPSMRRPSFRRVLSCSRAVPARVRAGPSRWRCMGDAGAAAQLAHLAHARGWSFV